MNYFFILFSTNRFTNPMINTNTPTNINECINPFSITSYSLDKFCLAYIVLTAKYPKGVLSNSVMIPIKKYLV